MQLFDVHILGCGSALPTARHKPSAQVVNLREKLLLLDCGEGTQEQWRRSGLGWQKLGHVFITHAHGDHVFGLPGLISTMGLMGRTAGLHIYGPAELKPYIDVVLSCFCQLLSYEVTFHVVDTRKHAVVFEDRSMRVWTLPLQHRTPCAGYLIEEKPGLPHIRREMIDHYGVPTWAINRIKQGDDWQMDDGTVVPHSQLTSPPDPVRRYAYCTDTMYIPQLASLVEGVDLLYHEATYSSEDAVRASKYGHSTATDAARLAKDAAAKRLMIGHYSARYDDETVLLNEAKAIFPNTILAKEGLQVHV